MDLLDTFIECLEPTDRSTPLRNSLHLSRKTSWGTPIHPPLSHTKSTSIPQDDGFEDVDLTSNSRTSSPSDRADSLDNVTALGLSFDVNDTPDKDGSHEKRFPLDDVEAIGNRSLSLDSERPFNKWMKHLQRRAAHRRKTVNCDDLDDTMDWRTFDGPAPEGFRHKKSSSSSSLGFVTAIREASISLASISVAPRSRRTGVSSRQHRTDRSSKTSNIGRASEDSSFLDRSMAIDQGVTNRLLHRRRVLEEIITTEENYLADVKFLMNVYVTLMGSIPTLSPNLRASINVNLNEIIELHEEILGELHRIVPHSEYTQVDGAEPKLSIPHSGHNRWRSLDAVPEHAGGTAWLQKIPGMTIEPKVAASVARIFGNKMKRLFIYEEYGAKYEIMIRDVSTAYRTMPQWEFYQKGLEALATSLSSMNSQQDNSKKALTIGDLLVKPIQRVCKYPLLFAELLKQTPVCDCPDSHMEIENVLIRLREATTKINRATDDPRMKAVMEKSWLLQDRLAFTDKSVGRSKSFVRGLGHIHLCGVLHVAWQTKDGVNGQYLICLLYGDFLLLASAIRTEQIYTVQACIGLSQIKIEEIDNGKGLQCHTAPFSWKVVFEHDHRLFEITMSACTPKEEVEWRTRLADYSSKDCSDTREEGVLTSLSLDIKALGTVFGKPGTIARRISIHRATTVGPMTVLCQVIIKNTSAFKDLPHSVSCTSINRSQSLLLTNRIPVLAPARGERVRLETMLSDVWTRDVLPFPGMTSRARSEHPIRASASSMMRKLSVASIASNFSKRSASLASIHKFTDDEDADASKQPPTGCEHSSGDSIMCPDGDDMIQSLFLRTQDEKENTHRDSNDGHSFMSYGSAGGPPTTVRRLATLRGKSGSRSWTHDGQRIIQPPLRTSSANSVSQNNVAGSSMVPDVVMEEKENGSGFSETPPMVTEQRQQKQSKWKGVGKRRAVTAEGILNLFR